MRIWNHHKPAGPPGFTVWLILAALGFVTLFGALVWIHYSAANRYQQELQAAINDLKDAKGTTLEDERVRQEAVKLRLENEQRTTFLQTLFATLGAGVGLLVTVSGIWVGFAQYLSAKERDRLDRASKDLESLWRGIAAQGDSNLQAAAIAALQHFLSPDKKEYHDRVAAALALAARMENRSDVVNRTLLPVVESAMRQITDSMRTVSWQKVRLQKADFSNLNLRGFDFRDGDLEEANLRGSILNGARFDAARLVRANLERAVLTDASLEYADLADASLHSANLQNANMRHIQLMNLNLRDCNLTGATLSHHDTDWRLSTDWRTAQFSTGVKERLIEVHGPACTGPRVLMLMWEFLPKVSGGAWTAIYHLLRNLRKDGADIVVAIPWSSSEVSLVEFGNEIPILPLGNNRPATAGKFTTYESERQPVASRAPVEYYSSPVELSRWFTNVALEALEQRDLKFDVVHAHDWQTFPAAIAISQRLNCPWVAHFHSLEKDRAGNFASPAVTQIETDGCSRANAIVVPSNFTKTQLVNTYRVASNKVEVVPNCLSPGEVASYPPLQNYSAKRVVFIGRLAEQKGPDLFVAAARPVLAELPRCSFLVYGEGYMRTQLKALAHEEGSVTLPPAQAVVATSAESPERLSSPIEILKIAPVEFDLASKHIQGVYPEKTGKARELLIDLVLSRGFTAHAVDHSEYSHVIELGGPVDEVHSRFAIKASGLRGIKRRDGRDLVSFPGWVSWARRHQAFQDASLVVVPSRAEPFGMVVLEAMEHGVPVLFDRSAGVGEVVESGIRIDSNDTSELVRLIVELLRNEDLWRTHATAELDEIRPYARRGYEQQIKNLWLRLASGKAAAHTQN